MVFNHFWVDGMMGPTHPYLVKMIPFPLSKSLKVANERYSAADMGTRMVNANPPRAMSAATKVP